LSIGEMKAPPCNAGCPARGRFGHIARASLGESSLQDRRDSRSNLRHSGARLSLHVVSVEPGRLLAVRRL